MSVSWITGIYNNSHTDLYMWAVDAEHLGVVYDKRTGNEVGRNDGGQVVTLLAGHHYLASWCGIPWYRDEQHFRALSTDATKDTRKALMMWQSKVDGKDGVAFYNGADMRTLGGYQFSQDAERRYALLIADSDVPDAGPVEIALELHNMDTTVADIAALAAGVVQDAYDIARTLAIEAGKAAVGKAI